MQKLPSTLTPQVRASRLLVQQKEEAQERVTQQGRTTRSECGHNSPNYLFFWRQTITLASPLSGHGQITTSKDGCDDGLNARERLTPVAVIETDDKMDDGTDDDG
jgi:hypothetical protein